MRRVILRLGFPVWHSSTSDAVINYPAQDNREALFPLSGKYPLPRRRYFQAVTDPTLLSAKVFWSLDARIWHIETFPDISMAFDQLLPVWTPWKNGCLQVEA